MVTDNTKFETDVRELVLSMIEVSDSISAIHDPGASARCVKAQYRRDRALKTVSEALGIEVEGLNCDEEDESEDLFMAQEYDKGQLPQWLEQLASEEADTIYNPATAGKP